MKIEINVGIAIKVKTVTAKNEGEEDVLFHDRQELKRSLLAEMVSMVLDLKLLDSKTSDNKMFLR